jgi:ribosomal protein L24E
MRSHFCTECMKQIRPGEKGFVAFKGHAIAALVCSEKCRIDFDDRYWQERADERERELGR